MKAHRRAHIREHTHIRKWRKLERRLGANHDDAVNMPEKCGDSGGKCDKNERKW